MGTPRLRPRCPRTADCLRASTTYGSFGSSSGSSRRHDERRRYRVPRADASRGRRRRAGSAHPVGECRRSLRSRRAAAVGEPIAPSAACQSYPSSARTAAWESHAEPRCSARRQASSSACWLQASARLRQRSGTSLIVRGRDGSTSTTDRGSSRTYAGKRLGASWSPKCADAPRMRGGRPAVVAATQSSRPSSERPRPGDSAVLHAPSACAATSPGATGLVGVRGRRRP